jgi:ABC-type polysaccharide/polyol phosphate transport system ATPase subunit
MTDLALKAVGLSKLYRIGAYDPYFYVRRSVKRSARQAVRAILGRPPLPPDPTVDSNFLWALKDISFEIRQGEAVGVIGRNGAGKTTLLKVLAHITRPTDGYVDVHGRLGALLEVGTGFHPELTGRENIFLNATILGMNKHEIEHRFDEIVEFAEVGKFIDTPVKHYSTGMFARLAFSVAAHMDSEIIVVDEVLSVGDTAFQKKSLGKMEGVMRQGRTVLFVSHNLPSVVSFCTRCLWLEGGKLVMDGPAVDVTQRYLDKSALDARGLTFSDNFTQVTTLLEPGEDGQPLSAPEKKNGNQAVKKYQSGVDLEQTSEETRELVRRGERYGSGKARFTSIAITSLAPDGTPRPAFYVGYDLQVDLSITAYERVTEANAAMVIYDVSGHRVIDVSTALHDEFLTMEPDQQAHVQFILRNVLLRPDTYRLLLWLGRRNVEDLDGIPFAKELAVEVNPATIHHFQVFPGVYQCQYQVSLETNQPVDSPELVQRS